MTEYRIESLADFAKVPDDRLTLCLEEFRSWVDMYRAMTHDGPMPDGLVSRFTWIDDGKRDVTFSVTLPGFAHPEVTP